MASVNSYQEAALFPGDEDGPCAPDQGSTTTRRLPVKALLAVGLSVAAAGLAGAVVVRRPAAHAPAKIEPAWAGTRLWITIPDDKKNRRAWKKYLTEECHKGLDAIQDDVMQGKRAISSRQDSVGESNQSAVECKAHEQTCTINYPPGVEGPYQYYEYNVQQCFPPECEAKNIGKGFQEWERSDQISVACCMVTDGVTSCKGYGRPPAR